MKKILGILIFSFLFLTPSISKNIGEGDLKLSDNIIEYFHQYLKGKGSKKPGSFVIAIDASYATYWYCPEARCNPGNEREYTKICARKAGIDCKVFARARSIKWKNDINPGKGKISKINSRLSFNELKAKLTELGFVGKISSSTTSSNQKNKKKVTKKYELKGERSIALSWDGYEDLIAGTVEFDETDYKGTLNIPLPNNDGTCDGTYSLQEGGKGTWQIACSNNMGAAGTLKWVKDGGVTGTGRDHNDKKVKFTVSKKS